MATKQFTERAWAAGFFDGEGSIQRRSKGSKRKTLLAQMQVVQSLPYGEKTLERFRDAVECGKIYGPYGPYNGNRKQYFTWSVSGVFECSQAVKKILPYLSEQKKDAALYAFPELVSL